MKPLSIRALIIAGSVLTIIGLLAWPIQLLPGNTQAVVEAQTKTQQALAAARESLNLAIAREKFLATKEAALAADQALEAYNAAANARLTEIQASLKDLARSAETFGKSALLMAEVEALEAEQRELAPSAVASPTPVVTPETEPNNTSATANAIDLSASAQPCGIVSGAINPGGDLDFFSFTAPAGSRIWIETDTGGTQNAGATSRDTVIDLLAADGTTVIENDDDDGTGNGGDGTIETGLASLIAGRTLTAGGTYFIRVRAFSATGIINPYRLFVTLTNVAATPEVESNNTAATANPIVTAGTPVGLRSGSIGAAGDVDYYSLQVTAGNMVYFSADADPERDGTGTDLVVEFRDPSDTLLLSVDSSITGSGANPAAEGANFTIATSGTYFVKVRHFSAAGTGTYHLMVSTCSGAAGGGCTGITCPANITTSNDPNQCGAVVNYPAPTTTGTCGTVTCSPASGSFFPKGTTTVTCTATAGPSCTFTVTVNDTQPPTITCPANVTAVTPVVGGTGVVVTYPPPTASDNCPGVTTQCTPPSGSTFAVGTTTVTCTATDASGNTASCSFSVTVFNASLQDESAGCNSSLLFSTASGQYRFCCNGTIFTGTGKVAQQGNIYTLTHNSIDRRVLAMVDGSTRKGNASLQTPPGIMRCTIRDDNVTNNTCLCGSAALPTAPDK